MVSLSQLWLPILLSAVAVFFASSIVHMVLKWHNSDYKQLPNEEEVRATLKSSANAPAMYFVPHIMDKKKLSEPENVRKFVEGPVALVTIRPPGPPKMGPYLMQWFILSLLVSAVAGYLASRTLPAGATFLGVCRSVGILTFMAYAVGSVSDGIWFGRPWNVVAKDALDSAIYATVTACVFAAMWPAAVS